MSAPILITKLFIPPIRSEIVSRPRLLERLNDGYERKLSLISAPAGFGKTSLASEWVDYLQSNSNIRSETDTKIAWISLDKDDNDPARFLTYLVAALKQAKGIGDDLADSLLSMLQSPQALPIKDIVTAMINEGTGLAGKLIIVLDDYHLIEEAPVNETLSFLIDYLPPQFHLVILTRDDPHLPLARLRAKRQMIELRAADLRFTPAEIMIFLQQSLGIQLSPDEIAELETHTEGWITGLHLVVISLQGQENPRGAIQDISGSHHFVLDYLLEEVLNQQPKEIQDFLLQTSVLDRLTGPLCNAVCFGIAETSSDTTEITKSQQILEGLEHANLFIIPLDDERRWYRYHHLFSDLLRLRLHQTLFDQETKLHGRASTWYEENGFFDDAIEHAIRAKDFDRTVDLINLHFESILKLGGYTKVWRWFNDVPVELLSTKPDLSVLNGWYLFSRGNLDEAELNLQTAENHLRLSGQDETKSPVDDLGPFERAKLSGRIAGVRAFIASYRGDIPSIIQNAHQALDKLPPQDLAWRSMISVALGDAYGMAGDMNAAYKARITAYETSRAGGNIYLTLLTSMKLAITFRMMGQLQRVMDICQEQFSLVEQKGLSQMTVVGWLLAIWAEVLAETDEIDAALEKARKGVVITTQSEDIAMAGWSQLCLGRILFTNGDIKGAESIFRKLETLSLERNIPPFITGQFSAWQARIFLARDELDRARQWVAARDLKIDGQINQLNEGEYISFARILIAQGQLSEAGSLLDRLLDAAKAVGRTSRMIEILILQSLAFDSGGKIELALECLERAIELAESGGFVRVFVDEGPRMAHLLYKAADRETESTYIQHLLAAFPILIPAQNADSKSGPSTSEWVEQLSEREIEVLHLIAEGLSRQEIAEKLILSMNTVKTHVRNIYSKLGVNNQMQAVAKARALGILEYD